MRHSRRKFIKTLSASTLALMSGSFSLQNCTAGKRPNILWIIAEDLAHDIHCYGNELAVTPNLDRLAEQGIRFTNTFATAPVCSSSRSALMTGMYQTSIGVHNHRSHRTEPYHLPGDVKVITDYFRQAGYYTANIKDIAPGIEGSVKTDWNFEAEKPFDGDDWTQLSASQPFFAQVNFKETHREFIRSEANPTDVNKVNLPPYYPDNEVTREDWAMYIDTINLLDEKVGAVLDRLEKDGLAENTIVFFFGDQGRPMPRGKQWLYDPGIRVPLIVRWPGHLKAQTVNENMVSMIDIAATSLQLAGIMPPQYMQGQVFLGDNPKTRDFIVAARDRCDETVDRIRCVRTKRFKYIRNFYPDKPYMQLNRYKETEYPVIRLMRRLHKAGKLNADQEKFMADSRPAEELYDIQNDPFELNNLAEAAEYQRTLKDLREVLDYWISETKDMGEQEEDQSVKDYYLDLMKSRYDERLQKMYTDEGMEFLPEMKL